MGTGDPQACCPRCPAPTCPAPLHDQQGVPLLVHNGLRHAHSHRAHLVVLRQVLLAQHHAVRQARAAGGKRAAGQSPPASCLPPCRPPRHPCTHLMQWAAVSTHWGAMRVPPQVWCQALLLMYCSEICNGTGTASERECPLPRPHPVPVPPLPAMASCGPGHLHRPPPGRPAPVPRPADRIRRLRDTRQRHLSDRPRPSAGATAGAGLPSSLPRPLRAACTHRSPAAQRDTELPAWLCRTQVLLCGHAPLL